MAYRALKFRILILEAEVERETCSTHVTATQARVLVVHEVVTHAVIHHLSVSTVLLAKHSVHRVVTWTAGTVVYSAVIVINRCTCIVVDHALLAIDRTSSVVRNTSILLSGNLASSTRCSVHTGVGVQLSTSVIVDNALLPIDRTASAGWNHATVVKRWNLASNATSSAGCCTCSLNAASVVDHADRAGTGNRTAAASRSDTTLNGCNLSCYRAGICSSRCLWSGWTSTAGTQRHCDDSDTE